MGSVKLVVVRDQVVGDKNLRPVKKHRLGIASQACPPRPQGTAPTPRAQHGYTLASPAGVPHCRRSPSAVAGRMEERGEREWAAGHARDASRGSSAGAGGSSMERAPCSHWPPWHR